MTDNYVSKGLRGEAFKREHPINQDDWAPILEEVLGLIQTLTGYAPGGLVVVH